MRTWRAAERAVRREIELNVGTFGGEHPLPLVIAVGSARPEAVIALGPLDVGDPTNTLAELTLVASMFRPTRALVALPVPSPSRRRSGVLMCYDATAVHDGLVELTRGRMWWDLGRRLIWTPFEVRQWKPCSDLLPGVAHAILNRSERTEQPPTPQQILRLAAVTGHRLRLAR